MIVTGPGHTGPDGLSVMPDYRDTLTVAELIDLVAYIKKLVPSAGAPASGGHDHGSGAPGPPAGGPGPRP